jgi:hypothetical protein
LVKPPLSDLEKMGEKWAVLSTPLFLPTPTIALALALQKLRKEKNVA